MTKDRIEKIFTKSSCSGYDGIIHSKNIILNDIYKDNDIFELLHNTELEKLNSPHEDYFNVNIFNFLKIPDAQSTVKNFICFEVDDINVSYSNKIMTLRQITFRVISHKDDVETIYGISRHDLLAALIKERFQWSNILGPQLKKTYDAGKVAENGYYYRTIYFQQNIPNDLQDNLINNRLDRIGRDYYEL